MTASKSGSTLSKIPLLEKAEKFDAFKLPLSVSVGLSMLTSPR